MLDITQLYLSLSMQADESGTQAVASTVIATANPTRGASALPKPAVTWQVTRSNHLNSTASICASRYDDNPELTTARGKALIDDLAAFGVTRLKLAGGEPMLRADLQELIAYASQRGIQPELHTYGKLLTREVAAELKGRGLASVTILQKSGGAAERQRDTQQAFSMALEACANCEHAGLEATIQIPLDPWTAAELPAILNLIERKKIRKLVFAHAVHLHQGKNRQDDLTHFDTRRAMDQILERAEDMAARGLKITLATDRNHTDGIYFYLRLSRRDPQRAAAAFQLLQKASACVQGEGVGVAFVDFTGNVFPDSHWTTHLLGNVRETSFSEIWQNSPDPLLRGLRDRLPRLKGRCGNCRRKSTCGGNLRVRAEQNSGDPWMSDPACYLSNGEIRKELTEQVEAMEDDVLLSEQAA